MSYLQNGSNMTGDGYSAYTKTQNIAENPRDIEYRLLAQVTTGLANALEKPDDTKMRVIAAQKNRDVWAALRLDLTNDANQLPKELRASLISVSLWIEKETHKIMSGTGDIQAVIEINRNIMAGLKPEKEKTEDSEKQKETPPMPSSSVLDAMSTDENA